jgi:hypothetical protein
LTTLVASKTLNVLISSSPYTVKALSSPAELWNPPIPNLCHIARPVAVSDQVMLATADPVGYLRIMGFVSKVPGFDRHRQSRTFKMKKRLDVVVKPLPARHQRLNKSSMMDFPCSFQSDIGEK